MAETATAPLTNPIHATRPNRVAVGTIVWLSSELMFFAGLFAMYFTHRAQAPEVWEESTRLLEIPFATVNTLILVLSSVTMQMAVFASERFQRRRVGSIFNVAKWGMHEWVVLTYLMGSVFVAGQVYEYANLVSEGITISGSTYGSVFYLTTGFHGLHVVGGLVAMLFVLGRSFLAKRFGEHEAVTTIVVSYYWHFVDVVWIGLFTVIYVLQ